MLNKIWKIVVWPWSDISNAKNMTLTLPYSVRHKRKELSYYGWPLLDGGTEPTMHKNDGKILNHMKLIPKDLVVQKVLLFAVFL